MVTFLDEHAMKTIVDHYQEEMGKK